MERTMSATDDVEKLEKKLEKLRAERATVLSEPDKVKEIDAQIREFSGQIVALEEEKAIAAQERAAKRSS
jgi:hypothetical protein